MALPPAAVRLPAVAGLFYPAEPRALAAAVGRLVPSGADAGTRPDAGMRAIAAVCPHAGWQYSGALAGALAGAVAVPPRLVVLAPNHTGRGRRAAVWPDGVWRLPGLTIPVDGAFCRALCDGAPLLLEPDHEAHEDEHAIEVLLPLFAARQPALHIAPVVLGGLAFAECEAIAAAIAAAIAGAAAAAGGATLIVASSDMSHYLPDDETRAIDALALAPLEALDARALFDAVRRHGITMCGYLPATVALLAARALGATRATRIGYATSADAGGDPARVVGYAAVTIS